jgi:hypothetical protein
MLAGFLLPEMTVRESGVGPSIAHADNNEKVLQLTLGITRIVEQESLDVSIWGSVDGQDWGKRPLVSFPQKFYCGTYTMFLDLAKYPEVRHLRAQWKVNRWGRGSLQPLFGLYLFAEVWTPAAVIPVMAATAAG